MASLAAVHQASGRERDLAALTFIETFERRNRRFGGCGRVRYRDHYTQKFRLPAGLGY